MSFVFLTVFFKNPWGKRINGWFQMCVLEYHSNKIPAVCCCVPFILKNRRDRWCPSVIFVKRWWTLLDRRSTCVYIYRLFLIAAAGKKLCLSGENTYREVGLATPVLESIFCVCKNSKDIDKCFVFTATTGCQAETISLLYAYNVIQRYHENLLAGKRSVW